MTRSLYTLRETDSVWDAHCLMDKHTIHHIPIIDHNKKLVGLLTQRDLLRASVSTFAEVSETERIEIEAGIPLAMVMTKELIVAEEEAPLDEVARHLLHKGHGCLPVLHQGTITGIVTEADFVKLSLKLLDMLETVFIKQ